MTGRLLLSITLLVVVSGCEFPATDGFDEKFGDQHFKSAIAAIELHNTRTGSYPESLRDLEYLGDWDLIWLDSVRYEKVESGYNLFIDRGWVGEPSLTLPAGYKTGLGLVDSNVTWIEEARN